MKTVVGAMCFVLRDGHVLLLHRNHPPFQGRWDGPGGLVEFGETPAEAAVREVYEESGLTITNVEPRAHLLLYNQDRQLTVSSFLFVATATEAELAASEEGLPEWIPLERVHDSNLIGFVHITLPLVLTPGSYLTGTILHDDGGEPLRYSLCHHRLGEARILKG